MKKNRIVGIALTVLVSIGLAIAGTMFSGKSNCKIEDSEGNLLAKVWLEKGNYILDCEYDDWAYVDTAFHEASRLLSDKEQITEEKAQKRLVKENVIIRTHYQGEIQKALEEAMNTSEEIIRSNSAGAISDIKGRLLACCSYSVGGDKKNYVIYPTWAGSTIKPISVYGPAVEENIVCWSSVEMDSPYTQIEDEEGKKVDWPINSTAYTYGMKTMAQALKESNNAIAVKTLKKSGVENALDWLQNRFGYTVEGERSILEKDGEDPILDNVALGYLEAGVTMIQMLENYQVFVSGGTKRMLRTVDYLKDNDTVVRPVEEVQRVFSEDTAYIVNRMLKGVVEEGGTGKNAMLENVDLCGKTGTSDDYRDNWFIGFTPEYICGVWYNCEFPETFIRNEATFVCKEVIKRLPDQSGLEFPVPSTVEQLLYCTKTGLLAGKYCAEKEIGYYKTGSFTKKCDCRAESVKNKEM